MWTPTPSLYFLGRIKEMNMQRKEKWKLSQFALLIWLTTCAYGAHEIPIRIFSTYTEMNVAAATAFQEEINYAKTEGYPLVIVAPTGNRLMYQELRRLWENKTLTLSSFTLITPAEYIGRDKKDPTSIRSYVWNDLLQKVNHKNSNSPRAFSIENWIIPNGDAPVPSIEKLRIQKKFQQLTVNPNTRVVVFWNPSPTSTPMISLPFHEFLKADRIILLASGEAHRRAGTEISGSIYEIHPSLFRLPPGRVELLLDQAAMEHLSTREEFRISHITVPPTLQEKMKDTPKNTLSFKQLATSNKVALAGSQTPGFLKQVSYLQIPWEPKVLYIHSPFLQQPPSILDLLKERNAQITTISEMEKTHLNPLTFWEYNLIVQPDTFTPSPTVAHPISYIAIVYDTHSLTRKILIPLSAPNLEKKVKALTKFHHSQVARSPYGDIIRAMGHYYQPPLDTRSSMEAYELIQLFPKEERAVLPGPARFDELLQTAQLTVIAPHPDDAEIGVGGMLVGLPEAKHISIINATSGARALMYQAELLPHIESYPSNIQRKILESSTQELTNYPLKACIRAEESKKALQFLHRNISMHHTSLPFYHSPTNTLGEEDIRLGLELIESSLLQKKNSPHSPILLFMPHPLDGHLTHRLTTRLFYQCGQRLAAKGQMVYVAYYQTPWSGAWNLFHYGESTGHRLGALIGLELLAGTGNTSLTESQVGGPLAEHYRVIEQWTTRK